MKEEWKTIVFRPSVDSGNSFSAGELERAFASMKLVDKTVCEDRIVYVFQPLPPPGNLNNN